MSDPITVCNSSCLIAKLLDVLDQLTAVGFFLSDSLVEAALRQVGE